MEKIKKRLKQRSIKDQMIMAFLALILCMLLSLVAVNKIFLEQYYIKYKEKDLKMLYRMINQVKSTEQLNQVLKTDGWSLLERSNIAIYVRDFDGSLTIRETTGTGGELLAKQLLANMLGQQKNTKEILAKSKRYEISRALDPRNHSEYVEMWGFLDNGFSFIMRTPIESIRDNVTLSMRFMVSVGCVIFLVGMLLIWYFSKKITDPILELAELSKKMAGLDFSAKYETKGTDEIAILGESFNTMSSELEKAIGDLKNANIQLQKDIAKRDELEKMRSEFLGNVSHELKTPIALIQGYAEGLKEGITEDEESRNFYCDVIVDEAQEMNKMVKNLLALNQLEFGENTLQFEQFDIVAMLAGILETLKILFQQKSIHVSFQHPEKVMVWGDEFLVEQVARNYLNNAINHTVEYGLIEIRVQVEESVRVSVFNEGDPIPKEDIHQIWDKFYKVDKARTREYGGNGIGLSIVKASMEAMKQSYGVRNYKNGVEFWFDLDAR